MNAYYEPPCLFISTSNRNKIFSVLVRKLSITFYLFLQNVNNIVITHYAMLGKFRLGYYQTPLKLMRINYWTMCSATTFCALALRSLRCNALRHSPNCNWNPLEQRWLNSCNYKTLEEGGRRIKFRRWMQRSGVVTKLKDFCKLLITYVLTKNGLF